MDKLISFHKNNLGAYNLVFKHFKWRWRLFILVTVITALYTILSTLAWGDELKWNNYSIFMFILLFFFGFLYINNIAKKIVRKRYEITPATFIWRDQSFEELQINLVHKYLSDKNILNDSKIELLRDLINKEAERKKKTGWLWPGFALAVLIPLWSQIIGWAYKHAVTVQDFVKTTGIFTVVIICIFIIVAMFKNINDEFSDLFYNRESQRLYDLVRILNNVFLKL